MQRARSWSFLAILFTLEGKIMAKFSPYSELLYSFASAWPKGSCAWPVSLLSSFFCHILSNSTAKNLKYIETQYTVSHDPKTISWRFISVDNQQPFTQIIFGMSHLCIYAYFLSVGKGLWLVKTACFCYLKMSKITRFTIGYYRYYRNN